jgi:tyrosyl-tRNA synthetase
MVSSGAEAKRLIQQNGVRANGDLITDINAIITLDRLPVILQVGKRKFVRLVSQDQPVAK